MLSQDCGRAPRSRHPHVGGAVTAHLHPDAINRRRARAIEVVPVGAAPVQIAGDLRHADDAQVLAPRADHPNPSWSGDVDVPGLVALHAIHDAFVEQYIVVYLLAPVRVLLGVAAHAGERGAAAGREDVFAQSGFFVINGFRLPIVLNYLSKSRTIVLS